MKKLFLLLVGTSLLGVIVIGILSNRTDADKQSLSAPQPTTVEALLSDEGRLNDQCRDHPMGTEADARAAQDICDKRDKVAQQLNDRGWCWGDPSRDQLESEKKWQPCPSKSAASEDTVPFDPKEARKSRQLEMAQLDLRTCLYDVARSQLMQGAKSKSNIERYMIGLCLPKYITQQRVLGTQQTTKELQEYIPAEAERQLALASEY